MVYRHKILPSIIAVIAVISAVGKADRPWGIYERDRRWNKTEVRVCVATNTTKLRSLLRDDLASDAVAIRWLTGFYPMTPAQRAEVKTAVASEYDGSHGIRFSGFDDCGSSVSLDSTDVVLVPILMRVDIPGKGLLSQAAGNSDVGPVGHRPVMIFLGPGEYPTPEHASFMLRAVAVHEFGHAAGLRHEHLLREGRNFQTGLGDPVCHAVLTDTSPLMESQSLPATGYDGVLATTYDRSSLMSYCNVFFYDQSDSRVSEIYTSSGVIPQYAPRVAAAVATERASLAQLGNFLDPRNSKIRFSLTDSGDIVAKYTLEPRLSSGDVHALRCLYGKVDSSQCDEKEIDLVRATPQLRASARYSVALPSRKSLPLNPGRYLVFRDRKAEVMTAEERQKLRLTPHCAFRLPTKLPAKSVKLLAPILTGVRSPSEWGRRVGGFDLQTLYGKSWECSSDLENGELWISDATLDRIFGKALKRL